MQKTLSTENKKALIEERIVRFFDKDFYSEKYQDIKESGINPLDHYIKIGWNENRRPNKWYTDNLVSEDLQKKYPGIPKFLVYLIELPNTDEQKFNEACENKTVMDQGHSECWHCNIMQQHFDGKFYRKSYKDISPSIDALIHFCEAGWMEERNPNPYFNTNFYLDTNKDVKEARINPFTHYLSRGKFEGRKPSPYDAVRRKQLREIKTLKEISQSYTNITPDIKIKSVQSLILELSDSITERSQVCLSISHDNYLGHTGGIQKFIKLESDLAKDRNTTYIHLYPTLPNILTIDKSAPSVFLTNCTVNDKAIGTFTLSEITEALNQVKERKNGKLEYLILHSYMGWHLESLKSTIENNFNNAYFYAHDYFSLCQEYRLIRNNVEPCDAPALNSLDCNVCIHGKSRAKHFEKVSEFFKSLDVTTIYPSATAQEIFENSPVGWKKISKKSLLIPHIEIERKPKNNISSSAKDQKSKKDILKVAYCGAPALHKGYHHFVEIFNLLKTRDDLEFFHFGNEKGLEDGIKYIETKLIDGVSMMSEKIEENEIDLVFIGSTWKETFNFVALEALQAGAALICLKTSGNVSRMTQKHQIGKVVEDWKEAADFISKISAEIKAWNATSKTLSFVENKSFFQK